MTVVPPADTAAFLAALPIGKVPGIGEKGRTSLAAVGVRLLGDVARLRPAFVEERFGAFGRRLLRLAAGEDDSPVTPVTPPKSVSSETTLEENTTDAGEIRRHILAQAERVGRRLREQGLAGRTIVLKLRHADFRIVTRSVTLERPTSVTRTIFAEAVRLQEAYGSNDPVRLVGVGVTGLEQAGGGQLDLLGGGEEDERWKRAERAMDEIVRRWGDGAVSPGSLARDGRRKKNGPR